MLYKVVRVGTEILPKLQCPTNILSNRTLPCIDKNFILYRTRVEKSGKAAPHPGERGDNWSAGSHTFLYLSQKLHFMLCCGSVSAKLTQNWHTKIGNRQKISYFEVLDVLLWGLQASHVAWTSFIEARIQLFTPMRILIQLIIVSQAWFQPWILPFSTYISPAFKTRPDAQSLFYSPWMGGGGGGVGSGV